MSPEQQQIAHYFGPTDGIRVSNTPPSGPDKLNDMADAWLEGDMQRYEVLAAEYRRRIPKFESRAPTLPARKGRPPWDYEIIRKLASDGMSQRAIASVLGCGKGTVHRALSLT